MIWVGQNSIAYLCLLKRGKYLTLKTSAPDFSARSMTKLYAKIKGPGAVSLFDFLKTWEVCLCALALNTENASHDCSR